RPLMNGPRSLMRTITDLPLRWLVTLIFVPKGSERCAAVIAAGFMRSPLAVLLRGSEYQEALPHWAKAGAVRPAKRTDARMARAAAPGADLVMGFPSDLTVLRRYRPIGAGFRREQYTGIHFW